MHAWRPVPLLLLALTLPAAAQNRSVTDVPLPPPPAAAPAWNGGESWRFSPVVSAGTWRDGAAGDNQVAVDGGLQLERRLSRHHTLLGELQYGWYRRHVLTAVPGGTTAGESDLGVKLAYGYEFLHHWSTSGLASGELLVGGLYRTFRNPAAPTTLGGPLAGLRLGYRLPHPLDLELESTYGFGASSDGSACCVPGKPKGVVSTLATIGIRASSARVRAGYRSELVVLEHGYRSFDGLALILDLSL